MFWYFSCLCIGTHNQRDHANHDSKSHISCKLYSKQKQHTCISLNPVRKTILATYSNLSFLFCAKCLVRAIWPKVWLLSMSLVLLGSTLSIDVFELDSDRCGSSRPDPPSYWPLPIAFLEDSAWLLRSEFCLAPCKLRPSKVNGFIYVS